MIAYSMPHAREKDTGLEVKIFNFKKLWVLTTQLLDH
jgi:hypothetical protein